MNLVSLDLNIDHLLNDKAKDLCKQKINKTICSNHGAIAHGCIYMAKLAPVNSKGYIDDIYRQKWAAMLNDFANSGMWTCGVLAVPSYVKLNVVNMKQLAAIYTFPFADPVIFFNQSSEQIQDKINKYLNWDVCVEEGDGGNENWDNCPYTIKTNLSKYPHKCPKCKSPCYLGFNQVDCSNGNCK